MKFCLLSVNSVDLLWKTNPQNKRKFIDLGTFSFFFFETLKILLKSVKQRILNVWEAMPFWRGIANLSQFLRCIEFSKLCFFFRQDWVKVVVYLTGKTAFPKKIYKADNQNKSARSFTSYISYNQINALISKVWGHTLWLSYKVSQYNFNLYS